MTKTLEDTILPCQQQWKADSESSVGRTEPNDMSSRWKHDDQTMTSESSFRPAELKHQISRTEFGRHDSSSRDLDTSHAGSWCKKK